MMFLIIQYTRGVGIYIYMYKRENILCNREGEKGRLK
jgi:hypothetical protein